MDKKTGNPKLKHIAINSISPNLIPDYFYGFTNIYPLFVQLIYLAFCLKISKICCSLWFVNTFSYISTRYSLPSTLDSNQFVVVPLLYFSQIGKTVLFNR